MSELFTDVPADAHGPGRAGLWTRRAVVAAFAALAVAGVADAAGQRPSTTVARAGGTTVRLQAPERVRGGLFFQARVEVRSTRRIAHPRLVLAEGWTESVQVNSIEPQPVSESHRDGRVVTSFDTLEPGDVLRVWFQFEVNPTAVGHRPFDLELDDGTVPLVRVRRDLLELP